MTDKAIKPFWVVFDPEGYAQEVGESKERTIGYLKWSYRGNYMSWEEYESEGYRCLECVVKEGE